MTSLSGHTALDAKGQLTGQCCAADLAEVQHANHQQKLAAGTTSICYGCFAWTKDALHADHDKHI
jgi:hypothetical protein